jgi:hypothetical protein
MRSGRGTCSLVKEEFVGVVFSTARWAYFFWLDLGRRQMRDPYLILQDLIVRVLYPYVSAMKLFSKSLEGRRSSSHRRASAARRIWRGVDPLAWPRWRVRRPLRSAKCRPLPLEYAAKSRVSARSATAEDADLG